MIIYQIFLEVLFVYIQVIVKSIQVQLIFILEKYNQLQLKHLMIISGKKSIKISVKMENHLLS